MTVEQCSVWELLRLTLSGYMQGHKCDGGGEGSLCEYNDFSRWDHVVRCPH